MDIIRRAYKLCQYNFEYMFYKKHSLYFGLIFLINIIKYINFANYKDDDILAIRCSFFIRNMLQ